MFDPKQFMQATITEVLDTAIKPCPVGEYPAVITKVDFTGGTITKDSSERKGDPWAKLVLVCEIQDQSVRDFLERDKVNVRYDVMLDVTPEGMLDLGKQKNVGLGQLREACGLNKPGQAFMFDQLLGQQLMVNVKHRPDPDKADVFYAEIRGVRPM